MDTEVKPLHKAFGPIRRGDLVSLPVLRDGKVDYVSGKVVSRGYSGQSVKLDHFGDKILVRAADVQAAIDVKNKADREAYRAANKPTDKQVRYALSLIAQLGDRWQDTQWGQGIASPDEAWLRSRSKREVSVLIDELRGETGHDDF